MSYRFQAWIGACNCASKVVRYDKGQTARGKDRLSGRTFTIEWYCDASGYSQAREFAEGLGDAEKRKLAVLFAAMGDIGRIQNKEKFRYEGDKIYAFKPKPHRFLSFFFEAAK